MSNISHESGIPLISYYLDVLQSKIREVCDKIGFDDSEITWVIFNPANRKKNEIIANFLVGTRGEDYGYCNVYEKKIWISILAISKDTKQSMCKISNNTMGIVKNKVDLLANVILNEITHIQTGSNHGEEEYDNQLKENIQRFYFCPTERLLFFNSNKDKKC